MIQEFASFPANSKGTYVIENYYISSQCIDEFGVIIFLNSDGGINWVKEI